MFDEDRMPQLTPLAVGALALLAERAMHPYEMYQLMRERQEQRIVRVSPGSLYRTVERLADEGLIHKTATEREGHRPERTVYAITLAGWEALRAALAEMLAAHVNEYPRFPLAMREARNLPPDRVAALLRDRSAQIGASLDLWNASIERIAAKGLPRHFALDVHFQRDMLAAERVWIDRVVAQLESGELSWSDPGPPEQEPLRGTAGREPRRKDEL